MMFINVFGWLSWPDPYGPIQRTFGGFFLIYLGMPCGLIAQQFIGRHFFSVRDIKNIYTSNYLTGQVVVNTKSLTGLLCKGLSGEWQKRSVLNKTFTYGSIHRRQL
jgi:hypothetical protein